jgi:hypothetical protein
MRESTFSVSQVTTDKIFIIDEDGVLSITNDAERVVSVLNHQYPGRRIIYRDTVGGWDELLHNNGTFTGFAPYQ